MQAQRLGKAGFTLLELLMVVIIIAILASLALPQYFRVVEHARSSQIMTLLASIRSSEMRYKANIPTQVYDNSVNVVNTDLAPIPALPAGWGPTITVTGTGAGSNVSVVRVGGVNTNGATIQIDLDNGMVCASNAAAGTEWGLPTGC